MYLYFLLILLSLFFFLCHLSVSVPFLWSLDFFQYDSKPMARTVDDVNRSEYSSKGSMW